MRRLGVLHMIFWVNIKLASLMFLSRYPPKAKKNRIRVIFSVHVSETQLTKLVGVQTKLNIRLHPFHLVFVKIIHCKSVDCLRNVINRRRFNLQVFKENCFKNQNQRFTDNRWQRINAMFFIFRMSEKFCKRLKTHTFLRLTNTQYIYLKYTWNPAYPTHFAMSTMVSNRKHPSKWQCSSACGNKVFTLTESD